MQHDRVNIYCSHISCGVLELSRISDDRETVLFQVASRLYHPSRGEPAAQIIYSDLFDRNNPSSSQKLSQLISDMKFGVVYRSDPVENPKTGNIISTFVWTVCHTTFKKWYSEERSKKVRKVGS